mgnify:CR=1 FL=1
MAMTWDARDMARLQRRRDPLADRDRRFPWEGTDGGEEPSSSTEAHGLQDAVPGHEAPVEHQRFSWGAEEGEEDGNAWIPQDMARELRDQGFLTAQEWETLGRAMRRGVQEV